MSASPPSPLASLFAAAEQVRAQLRLADYDSEAVTHLDRFIQGQHGKLPPAQQEGVVKALGCFLGQCLVQTYGGEWAQGPDGSTGVGLADKLFFNPFYLVSQQLNKGQSASVAAFFASVPARLAAPKPARKGWIS